MSKSLILTKAAERLAGRAITSRVWFGKTEGIESPIGLMEKLAEPLARDDWGSELAELITLYRETLAKLEQQPAEKGKGISDERKSVVRSLGNLAMGWFQRGLPEDKAKEIDELGGKGSANQTRIRNTPHYRVLSVLG